MNIITDTELISKYGYKFILSIMKEVDTYILETIIEFGEYYNEKIYLPLLAKSDKEAISLMYKYAIISYYCTADSYIKTIHRDKLDYIY